MNGPLVLGLDVGGTTSRVRVHDLQGRVLGEAQGAGGNPVAHGEAAAMRNITETLCAALDRVDPAKVAAGVVGLAGGLMAGPALSTVWCAAGLAVSPTLVGDLELAYASGAISPAGSVVVSGTGAAAAEIRDFSPQRLADGHGWLLGDRGSGYWLGRGAVQALLAAVDAGESVTTGLCARVVAAFDLDPDLPLSAAVIRAAHADPPVRLARLAPLVLDAARAGDPVAARLVERAADHLLTALSTVRACDSDLPVVLAGGVLSADSPLSTAVRTRITARWPAARISPAGNTAGAAAWLAARELDAASAAALHGRFVS